MLISPTLCIALPRATTDSRLRASMRSASPAPALHRSGYSAAFLGQGFRSPRSHPANRVSCDQLGVGQALPDAGSEQAGEAVHCVAADVMMGAVKRGASGRIDLMTAILAGIRATGLYAVKVGRLTALFAIVTVAIADAHQVIEAAFLRGEAVLKLAKGGGFVAHSDCVAEPPTCRKGDDHTLATLSDC